MGILIKDKKNSAQSIPIQLKRCRIKRKSLLVLILKGALQIETLN